MNTAVTIGVKTVDGRKTFTVITDPNTPHREQRKAFRHLRRKLHGEFDEVQLWTSSAGRVKKQRTTAHAMPEVAPVVATPVPDGASLLDTPSETVEAAAETVVSGNSTEGSNTSPAPDAEAAKKAKKAATLKKAREAAAAKRKAK